MNNRREIVPAFVNAYYTTTLCDQKNVFKFYSPNASYYRPDMKSQNAVTISNDKVRLPIKEDSTVTIINYVSVPSDNDLSVSVTGQIQSEDKVKCFSQFFVLRDIGGRICIVSDIYNEFAEDDFKKDIQPVKSVEAPAPQPQQQNHNQQQNHHNNYHNNSNRYNDRRNDRYNNSNRQNNWRGKGNKGRNNGKNSFVYRPECE
ncbi:hypothetical protein TRFO_07155 [Tritrichomonas foetus]|uniref:NTF2 domain-containing protein n=1 Tax=Tritrichomonas foetus TaxID=1144522 RepID=A0A1J4JTD5_9EUKA|nr:hypothetical protein TRFO_07155 [Tritrichomonas foetus]|eukprot:OHT02331.1 hypothetical protein TRFO_07155 [Tritrichomonas foetus]